MEKKETIVKAGDNIIGRSKIQEGGSFTIPKKVMNYLKVKPGDKLCLELEGLDTKVVVLTKA